MTIFDAKNMIDILFQVKHTAYGTWVGTSLWAYPILEILHLVGIVSLVGSITLIDLRLLGFSRILPITVTEKYLLPWVWAGFTLILFSGFNLFISDAENFLKNPFFLLKMALIAMAGLNAAFFQFRLHHGVAQWNSGKPTPLLARVCACCSIILWFLAVACGRLIAYPEMYF